MDSMVEIFYEEGSALIGELREAISEYEDDDAYDIDFVKKVFRAIHTLKADSTMMLLDPIAALSRTFESLLYFYRNNKIEITDKAGFDKLLNGYIGFVSDEMEKLVKGEPLFEGHTELEVKIKDYTERAKAEYKDKSPSEDFGRGTEEADSEPDVYIRGKRQVYYIPSASGDVEKKAAKDGDAKKEEPKKPFESKNENVVLVKQKDIDAVYTAIRHYNLLLTDIEKRFDGDEPVEVAHADLVKFNDIGMELSNVVERLTKTDFSAMAKKMELLVDEMSKSLKKPVKLNVMGEDTLVDKSKREKISSALVHVIRNAVDHGIEDMETREEMGKPPMGMIRLTFSGADGKIEITVEDDGAGVDKKAVLKSAAKHKLLKKPAEQYTDEEILGLLAASGVSTTEHPNDYSGRGVGMDVINHNINSLGGTLKIKTREGVGTKVSMII